MVSLQPFSANENDLFYGTCHNVHMTYNIPKMSRMCAICQLFLKKQSQKIFNAGFFTKHLLLDTGSNPNIFLLTLGEFEEDTAES